MRRHLVLFALPLLVFLVVHAAGQDAQTSTDTAGTDAAATDAAAGAATQPLTTDASPETIERGRYLVEGVGMCGQCHSPRNATGELILSQWLQGAAVPVTKPNGYEQAWAHKAPRIANLPQHTDEEFVTLMTTGINRDGKELMAPMPPFRMSEDDALAIAAYLRSL